MPFVETRFISPTTLTTSAASALYTVPTGYSAIIKQLVVTNITGTAATFTFYIGAASAGNALFSGTSVAANDTVIINLSQVVTTGEVLRALASTGSALNLTVSGVLNDGPLASTATYIADNAITSAKIADGAIVNADINALAAIDKTKISGTAVTVADTGTVTSTMILDGTIATADIAANAVTQAKLSTDIPLSGMRNVVINGAMQIAQRSTSVAIITSGESYRTVDRFVSAYSTTGTWTQSQSTDAPPGFGNSIKFECTTANVSLSAGSYLIWGQTIEGQNLQQFAKGTSSAKPFSLSFWVKAFQTGTYVAELYDNTNNRQVTKTFTINASATWEYKTIQFPADTTGAFANSNAGAFSLYFWLVAGTNYTSGTATGLWTTAVGANRAVGLSVNGASSASNYFQFTGVQLEANTQATPFEQRPIGVELALCQRYYVQYGATDSEEVLCNGATYATSATYAVGHLPVEMRRRPDLSVDTNATRLYIAGGAFYYTASPYNLGKKTFGLYHGGGAPTAGQAGFISTAANAYVKFSAEL